MSDRQAAGSRGSPTSWDSTTSWGPSTPTRSSWLFSTQIVAGLKLSGSLSSARGRRVVKGQESEGTDLDMMVEDQGCCRPRGNERLGFMFCQQQRQYRGRTVGLEETKPS